MRIAFVQRLEITRREMRRADKNQSEHGQDSRYSKDHSKATAMSWPVKVDQTHDHEDADSGENDVLFQNWNVEITESRPSAQRCRNRQVRNEQERADYGKQPAL